MAVIESHYKIKYSEAITLSEQFIVDCVLFGCGGGDYYNGLKYVKDHCIVSSSYICQDAQGTCPSQLEFELFNITGFALFLSMMRRSLKLLLVPLDLLLLVLTRNWTLLSIIKMVFIMIQVAVPMISLMSLLLLDMASKMELIIGL